MSETVSLVTAEQKRGIIKTVLIIVAFMAMLLALLLNKILTPRQLSTMELRANGAVVFDSPRIIKDFTLRDHQGADFDLKALKNQWTVIYFGFTHCPDICPTTLAVMAQVNKKLDPQIREQLQFAMITLDPVRDTQETLAQYVPFFDPTFLGITGEFLNIMSLTRDVNVAFRKVMQGESYTIDHSDHLVLINPYGHYHAFFKPPFELSRLKLTLQSIVTTGVSDH